MSIEGREAVINLSYERLATMLTDFGIQTGELNLLQTVEIESATITEDDEDVIQILCKIIDPVVH